MSLELTVIMELTIAGNNQPAIRAMLPSIIHKVKHNENGILNYQWYINEEEGKCYILEEFENAAAWLAHHQNSKELLPPLFLIAPLTRWEVFGHVPQNLRDVMEPQGVVLNQPLAGFRKEIK